MASPSQEISDTALAPVFPFSPPFIQSAIDPLNQLCSPKASMFLLRKYQASSKEGHASSPAYASVASDQGWFALVPERTPDKYSRVAHINRKTCAKQVSDFFKDSVKRAQARNHR
ncbi:hypothetical protein E4U53_007633 [Claviceps sorghi]|nr:hypothetical protein E4U53_007633 [Claviceps sorghi]